MRVDSHPHFGPLPDPCPSQLDDHLNILIPLYRGKDFNKKIISLIFIIHKPKIKKSREELGGIGLKPTCFLSRLMQLFFIKNNFKIWIFNVVIQYHRHLIFIFRQFINLFRLPNIGCRPVSANKPTNHLS